MTDHSAEERRLRKLGRAAIEKKSVSSGLSPYAAYRFFERSQRSLRA